MAEEQTKLKNVRAVCKRNFTTKANRFERMVKEGSPFDILVSTFEQLQLCFQKLEDSQEAFIAVADLNDIDTHPDGVEYLTDSSNRFDELLSSYSKTKKDAAAEEKDSQVTQLENKAKADEEKRKKEMEEVQEVEKLKLEQEKASKFDSVAEEFKLEVEVFKRKTTGLQNVLKDGSDADKRREFRKLEGEFQFLRKNLICLAGIDPSKDTKPLRDLFVTDVEDQFNTAQIWFISALKDSPEELPQPTPSTSSHSSSMKKEPVGLPNFKGDENHSPFLKFPIWRKEWEKLIVEYPDSWHCNLLNKHVDEHAREQYVGYETDYKIALARLDTFYGNPVKVVDCTLSNVMSPSDICDGDYMSLMSYCTVLESNFNRLKSMSLEHEMSNTSTMTLILRKFPKSVVEKWAEHRLSLKDSAQTRPFPAFIDWLVLQKKIWEQVAATDSSTAGPNSVSSFASLGDSNDQKPPLKCFQCGKEGHKQRSCPNRNQSNIKN